MELKQFWLIIKADKKVFFAVWLGCVLIASLILLTRPIYYESKIGFFFTRQNLVPTNTSFVEKSKNNTQTDLSPKLANEKENDLLTESTTNFDYNQTGSGHFYDYFYIFEANSRLVTMLLKNLSEPDFRQQFLFPEKSLNPEEEWIVNKTKVESPAPGFLIVTLRSHQQEYFASLRQNLTDNLKELVDQLATVDNPIKIVVYPAAVKPVAKPFRLVLAGSLVLGFWLAIFIVFWRHYWREEEKNHVQE